jgi:hypothetical protein
LLGAGVFYGRRLPRRLQWKAASARSSSVARTRPGKPPYAWPASPRTSAALFVLIGADPHSNWLARSLQRDARGFLLTGFDLDRRALDRPPMLQETSTPGVFAADGVRHGSVKRVA